MNQDRSEFKTLFTLSRIEVQELLGMISKSQLSSTRATYWPLTRDLLKSKIFHNIEKEVEKALGREVFYIFDEVFTPFGKPGSTNTFQAWHKDVEDDNFEEGCWNIWIPLFSSGSEIQGLELILDTELNQYDHVLDQETALPALNFPHPIGKNDLGFMKMHSGELKICSKSKVEIYRPPVQLNGVYLLNSSVFHAAVPSDSFQVRFGIKFALSPFTHYNGKGATDIQLFAYFHRVLQAQLGSKKLSPKEMHYEVARLMHDHLGHTFTQTEVKTQVLYQTFFESLRLATCI